MVRTCGCRAVHRAVVLRVDVVDARADKVWDARNNTARTKAATTRAALSPTSQARRRPVACRDDRLRCCAARCDVQTDRHGRGAADMWDGGLTTVLMFVPAANTREAWKVSTDQAHEHSTRQLEKSKWLDLQARRRRGEMDALQLLLRAGLVGIPIATAKKGASRVEVT